jgi:GNAT superfamily N-acetyltransferase
MSDGTTSEEGAIERRRRPVRVWYLERHEAPGGDSPPPPSGELSLRHETTPDLDDYRRLYRRVGDPWLWFARRRLDEPALKELLEHPGHELWVLRIDGEAVGFAELDFRDPADVELVYFGLVSESIGRGAGSWLLRRMMDEAWSRPATRRFWLHTCELDHPGALAFYQRNGLSIYDEELENWTEPADVAVW